MSKLVGSLLMACLSVGLAAAQTKKDPGSAGQTPEQIIKQLEHDWMDAAKARNVDKLSQILADDWVGWNYQGTKDTKQTVLADLKSDTTKLESFEFGPMDVVVFGNVAVVQGTDTEKSTYKGKDSSGKYVWMDVFVKRGGKWQAARSQSARVEAARPGS